MAQTGYTPPYPAVHTPCRSSSEQDLLPPACSLVSPGTPQALTKGMQTMTDTKATLEALKATAAAQVAKYPQYNGHFQRYTLVRIKCEVRTKLGLAFVAGEYAIAVERDITHPLFIAGPRRCVTVWSRRNQCDTAVHASDVAAVR